MATTARTKAEKAASRARGSKPKKSVAQDGLDATLLLESDHREVDGYFEQYENAKTAENKKQLAIKICLALKVHAQVEEEIFYPAARKATKDNDLIDEATVEHAGAKVLIAEIEAMQPGQPLYDAKVKVLSEQIRHHVREEEEELFPEVRNTKLDLEKLGADLAARKVEITAALKPSAPTVT